MYAFLRRVFGGDWREWAACLKAAACFCGWPCDMRIVRTKKVMDDTHKPLTHTA